jgi:MSHA biogenesis protein MshP
MCPDRARSFGLSAPRRPVARGFTIVAAIFLLVVLAALGAFVLTVSSSQHMSSAQDLQGARAYQAARSGIEWGAYQALRNSSCAASTPISPGGTLSGISVTVLCTSAGWTYSEAGDSVTLYQLTVTASQGTVGSATYVERQLQATVAN